MPHNLRIVDYVIGIPGSVHDSNAFAKTRISRHPQTFFGAYEWLWADSAYGARPWCVVPYKRPAAGGLTDNQKKFNYRLSKVVRTILMSQDQLNQACRSVFAPSIALVH